MSQGFGPRFAALDRYYVARLPNAMSAKLRYARLQTF